MNSAQKAIKSIPWTTIDGQSIIACPSQNSLILLNQIATKIWQAYRLGHSETVISDSFQTTYHISANQANGDVAQTLDQWRRLGLFDAPVNTGKAKPWSPDESTCETTDSTQQSEHSVYYQLSSIVFCIDYHHEDTFDSIHRVLKHLSVGFDISDADVEKPCHLQIDYSNGKYQLSGVQEKPQQFDTLDELIEVIQWALIEIAYRGGDWLTVLHSAALGDRNGGAIVFIAQRGSGKSTLTRLLQQHELIYLADDVVPIDDEGALQPMPMCQRFKQGSWNLLDLESTSYTKTYARQEGHFVKYVRPITGNTKGWAKNWPVKAIIYPQYNANIEKLTLKKLTNIESITKLCESGSVFGGAIDQTQLDSIVRWISCTPSYSLSYSKVNCDMVNRIKPLFG